MRWALLGVILVGVIFSGLSGCEQRTATAPADATASQSTADIEQPSNTVVFLNATIWDGTDAEPVNGASLVVADGRVVAVGSETTPNGAAVVDLGGAFVMPGLINTHGHVNDRWAGDEITDAAEKVRDGLRLYARYGVTTVVSLGGAPDAAFSIGDSIDPAALDHARFYIAGPVVANEDPAAAREQARDNLRRGVDWLKLRVDDNLGRGQKMPWESVEAVLDVGRAAGVPVATHIFYLADAERLLAMGSGMIAHSVRDVPVTDAFVDALERSGVCYVPTLTREVSTFVYGERPDFFDDPFFARGANAAEVARVSDPEFMVAMATSEVAAGYRSALVQAYENLAILYAADARIAFGTDSGPGGRFPGYFEHLELSMMVETGMSAKAALISATSRAAECVGLPDVGTLEPGKWADFLVLAENPLDDIRQTKSLRNVYIAGSEISR